MKALVWLYGALDKTNAWVTVDELAFAADEYCHRKLTLKRGDVAVVCVQQQGAQVIEVWRVECEYRAACGAAAYKTRKLRNAEPGDYSKASDVPDVRSN